VQKKATAAQCIVKNAKKDVGNFKDWKLFVGDNENKLPVHVYYFI
jgi:hypothetical protein